MPVSRLADGRAVMRDFDRSDYWLAIAAVFIAPQLPWWLALPPIVLAVGAFLAWTMAIYGERKP